jgi:DNA-binding transcriptional ArsR family regulator
LAYKIDGVFSALADANRRQILTMLVKNRMSVNSIAQNFRISRPAVSKHLKVLQKTNLVISEQDGRERYYSLNAEPLKEVKKWLMFYDKFWNKKLNQLKHYLEENDGINKKEGAAKRTRR